LYKTRKKIKRREGCDCAHKIRQDTWNLIRAF